MSRQKKKRNHWVSQSYLRAFAVDESREKIWRLSRTDGEPQLKPISKVAVKFYLYAPNGPGGRDYGFEDRLATLEELFGAPFWKTVCKGYVDLGDESVRKGLALLAANMYLRNPLRLQTAHQIHKSLSGFVADFAELPDELEIGSRQIKLDKASWPAYRDADEDDVKRLWLAQIGSAGWLAKIFLEMRFAIICADRPVFITTDNPVVPLHRELRFRGFRNPETSVVFPLSPTRLLWLDHRHKEPDGQYYPLKDNGGGMNGLLWREAIEHMFAHRDPHLVCAEMLENAEEMGFA